MSAASFSESSSKSRGCGRSSRTLPGHRGAVPLRGRAAAGDTEGLVGPGVVEVGIRQVGPFGVPALPLDISLTRPEGLVEGSASRLDVVAFVLEQAVQDMRGADPCKMRGGV